MPVHRGWFRSALTVSVLAVTVTAVPKVGAAAPPLHPEGVLKLSDRQLVQGRTVQIGGEKFSRNGNLDLVLVGVAGRFTVGQVAADSVGGFESSLEIPADLEVGSYRLVAIASDGDEVASLNVDLLGKPEAELTDGSGLGEKGGPSAEPLAVDRAGRPWVTGGAVVGIVLALVAGGMLLRRQQGRAAD